MSTVNLVYQLNNLYGLSKLIRFKCQVIVYLHVYYDVDKSYLIPKATQDTRMYTKSEACMNFIFSRVIRSDKYMLYYVHSLLDLSQGRVQ